MINTQTWLQNAVNDILDIKTKQQNLAIWNRASRLGGIVTNYYYYCLPQPLSRHQQW